MGFGILDPRELTEQQRKDVQDHRRQREAEAQEVSLSQLRKLAGMGVKDLATGLKVDAARVKKLESGDLNRVQLATLRRHAEAIGCRLELRYIADGAYAVFN